MKHENHVFEDQTIRIDGESYHYCTFRNCILMYHGYERPQMSECTFIDTNWGLDDAASNTVHVLKYLWDSNEILMRDFVGAVVTTMTGHILRDEEGRPFSLERLNPSANGGGED